MSILINLFAGPGAGKSTTAAGIFTLLKLHNIESELVTEFAKELVWEERHRTFQNQLYLFGKQQHRLWRVSGKVDVMITDCPLLLSVIYNDRYGSGAKEFNDFVLYEWNKYNNVNFFIDRVKPYMQYGRNESEDQARDVDNEVKTFLDKNEVPYISINGDLQGINDITSFILTYVGTKPKFELKEK